MVCPLFLKGCACAGGLYNTLADRCPGTHDAFEKIPVFKFERQGKFPPPRKKEEKKEEKERNPKNRSNLPTDFVSGIEKKN